MELTPYLNFDGKCEEAFRFYAKLLGGTITFMQRHGETPMAEHAPAGWHDKIMHATLTVDGSNLMGSDAPPGRYQPPQGTYVTIAVQDAKEGERVLTALAEGGNVELPYQSTFWSPGFGMVIDRFGTRWMVNSEGEPA